MLTLRRLFDEPIISEVLAVPLNSCATRDRLMWMATKSGAYRVRSAYNLIRESENPQHSMQATLPFQPSANYGTIFGT